MHNNKANVHLALKCMSFTAQSFAVIAVICATCTLLYMSHNLQPNQRINILQILAQ